MPSLQPKFITTLQSDYGVSDFKVDAIAGLTVAIVALPLSMAIAIASHAPPQAGLYAAIIGGFIISALGGSKFQIGGPAGAFIVIVASIIDRKGFDGLLIASMMAGVMMISAGLLRLGTYVRCVPHAVTVGFTAGIAVIIFASQLRDLLGLSLGGPEPSALAPKLTTLSQNLHTVNMSALAIAALTIAIILLTRRLRAHWPALLIAVCIATLLSFLLKLPTETIGMRFGALPAGLSAPSFPSITLSKFWDILPDAVSIALLGSIEALLSAVVADKMSGDQHRSNAELVAQGAANIVTPIFGGIVATGTVARTATNVKANARSPVSGMLHAAYLLAFISMASSLLTYIPLAALAGVLAVVSFNMVDWKDLRTTSKWQIVAVIAVTFFITIFRDLIEGIVAGILLHLILNWSATRAAMRR